MALSMEEDISDTNSLSVAQTLNIDLISSLSYKYVVEADDSKTLQIRIGSL